MFYPHLYYGLTDTIYISQNGLCNIPWCKSYTIYDKTVAFVLSDTKSLQNPNEVTQIWNISLAHNNSRIFCEVEGLILNNPDGPEHEHSIVVLELKIRRGQYQVKKANCFYVVGKTNWVSNLHTWVVKHKHNWYVIYVFLYFWSLKKKRNRQEG